MDTNNLPDDIKNDPNVTNDTKSGISTIEGMVRQSTGNALPPEKVEIGLDYYLEIARQWDEEDLTSPPHSHYS